MQKFLYLTNNPRKGIVSFWKTIYKLILNPLLRWENSKLFVKKFEKFKREMNSFKSTREPLDPIANRGTNFAGPGWLNHDSDSAGWMKNGWAIVSGIIVSVASTRGAIIVEEFIPVALTDVTNLSVALNLRPSRLMTF